jgi:hypothetical protein
MGYNEPMNQPRRIRKGTLIQSGRPIRTQGKAEKVALHLMIEPEQTDIVL